MKIGEILVKQGYTDEAFIEKALQVQIRNDKRIGEILLDLGAIDEAVLNEILILQKNLAKDRFDKKETYLKTIPPFNSLPDKEIESIAKTMTWNTFLPGEVVIRQGNEGVNFYLISSGLAKAYLEEEGKETVVGFLGEGECFGEISLLTQGPATANIQTIEQTLCLVQGKEEFLRMTERHPPFYHFFNQLLAQRMRSVYKELLSENPGIGQVEPFLYRKQVKEMMSASQPFCAPESTIREATRKMIGEGLGRIVVVDDQKKPKGILRLNEIVRAVLLEEKDPQQSIETIMERDYHFVEARGYFFDALHEMVKHKTHELVVLEGEKAAGILTGFDLLRFRGREVLSLLRNIESAPDISQLRIMKGEVEKVLKALMADGALASQACKIVSEFNDKMVRRIIKLTEEELGPSPLPYAWLGLGSEGRKEQTLITDQDNAVIFSGAASEEAQGYFKRFSVKVVQGLNQCGFPLCKGGVMADQPKWFGNLEEWKRKISRWVMNHALDEENMSDVYTFLDFRSIDGEPALAKELKSHLFQLTQENPSFLKILAREIVSIPIPLGFFKNFVVQKSGQYKNRMNLKIYGLVPLVTCIKLCALNQGVMETNTLERIKVLTQKKVLPADQGEFLEQAFEIFLTLKIRNNLNDLEEGKEFGSHVDPTELSTRQKQLLKEAFLAVSQLQKTTRSILKVEEQGFGILR